MRRKSSPKAVGLFAALWFGIFAFSSGGIVAGILVCAIVIGIGVLLAISRSSSKDPAKAAQLMAAKKYAMALRQQRPSPWGSPFHASGRSPVVNGFQAASGLSAEDQIRVSDQRIDARAPAEQTTLHDSPVNGMTYGTHSEVPAAWLKDPAGVSPPVVDSTVSEALPPPPPDTPVPDPIPPIKFSSGPLTWSSTPGSDAHESGSAPGSGLF